MSVVPKISIRKKPLASSGMMIRIKTTAQPAGLPNSVRAKARIGVVAASLSGGNRASCVIAMLTTRQQALRPNGQHEHHDQERHHDRIGRDVDRAELLGETDD